MAEHAAALAEIETIVDRGGDDVLVEVVEALHDGFEHYSWLGIYVVEGDDLVLGPWKGPEATEHVRIPVGQGICGAAAATGETEIVDDVNADPRYLACFSVDALRDRRPDRPRGARGRRDRHRLGPAGGFRRGRPRLPGTGCRADRAALLVRS